MARKNPFLLSLRRTRHRISPRKQLTAPASVGVTMPTDSASMIAAKRMMISITCGKARQRSAQLTFSAGGPHVGWRRQISITVAPMRIVRIAAGISAPKKSCEMDCPDCRPYTTSTMLGGTITPSVAPAATEPVLSVGW